MATRQGAGTTPKIKALRGPLEDTEFTLAEGEVSIGRDPSNTLRINDPSLSRHHCRIFCEGGRLKIRDLESTNGTLVNGAPIEEQWLEHGDRITIGSCLFLVVLAEEAERLSSPVSLDDTVCPPVSEIELRQEDTRYLQASLSVTVPVERAASDLHALLKISRIVHSIREFEPLQQRLLELVFEAVPAERGAILLREGHQPEYATIFGWDKASGEAQPIRVSRTIADRVLAEGTAVLTNRVREQEAFQNASSLVGSGVESVLCVPLRLPDRTIGIIYLETTSLVSSFDEEHLHFLNAAAAMAATSLENTRRVELLEAENRRLREDIAIEHEMVGESRPMRQVYEFIAKVAPLDSTVLICGENGTGKELAARAIHQNSPRANQPFVAFNCATLSENLLESELFGHEKGAFTGATYQKKGKLELAHGGTVLLDEVAELAPAIQAKLLRVLQEQEFERVGGTRTIRTDVRLIACTNRNLEEAIEAGEFRRDLYYRLNVVRLVMPTLRERGKDITLLGWHFTQQYAKKCNRRVDGIAPEAERCLLHYSWPGNVRELQNAIERAVVLGSTDQIRPEDLPESVLEATSGSAAGNYHESIQQTKKDLILNAMRAAEGNYTEAARLLGLHPNYLHRLIRNLGLKKALKK